MFRRISISFLPLIAAKQLPVSLKVIIDDAQEGLFL
jgi:hypothetical protein